MKASTLACGHLHQNHLQVAKQYWIYPQILLFVSITMDIRDANYASIRSYLL